MCNRIKYTMLILIRKLRFCVNGFNQDCSCFHSDPKFPDLEPDQTAHLRGRLPFYEGNNIETEFKRIEAAGWRSN